MTSRSAVSCVARVALCVVVLGCSPAAHAVPPAAPPAPPPPAPAVAPGAKMEEIQETTVGTLSGVDVGVANMWERDYVDGTGANRKGLTARLDYEVGSETRRVVVGEGSVLELGGVRWEVVRLVKTPGQNGAITLRPTTP